jgi:RNA polymerase sigma-70 factor (ECF subfamily)
VGDGGGVVPAALEPIVGAGPVADLLGRATGVAVYPAHINGHPALIVRRDGEIDTVMAVRVDGDRITGLYAVRNPEKLSRVEQETALRR